MGGLSLLPGVPPHWAFWGLPGTGQRADSSPFPRGDLQLDVRTLVGGGGGSSPEKCARSLDTHASPERQMHQVYRIRGGLVPQTPGSKSPLPGASGCD